MDYPKINNEEWFSNIIIKQKEGKMILEKKSVGISKWKPPWMKNSSL